MKETVSKYRSVFISDLHLGSAGCKTDNLRQFLESFDSENLFLVGDIIDGWVGPRHGDWSQDCTNIVRTMLSKSEQGCNVCYTPGNHDAFMRQLNGSELGNILIDHSFVHTLANGKRLLIVHGDLFDKSCTDYPSVAWAGAWVYEYMTILNGHVNRGLTKVERRPIDFCSVLKHTCKKIVKRGSSYEFELLDHALELDCDGVVCGHVHRPAINIDEEGHIYVNCGDWVQNQTAVVEHFDGRLELIKWSDLASITWKVAESSKKKI